MFIRFTGTDALISLIKYKEVLLWHSLVVLGFLPMLER